VWPDSFSFCSLVSSVSSSTKASLLAIANISSGVLGLFMVRLQINDESLLEEHDNRFVVNLRDEVSLVAKALDELSE
jgi:hypothetical protein